MHTLPWVLDNLQESILKKRIRIHVLALYGDWFTRYSNNECLKSVKAYAKIAEKYDMSLTHLALAFVNSQPFVTSNIIGATTMDQLRENIESVNIELSEDILEEINQVHSSQPNPAP